VTQSDHGIDASGTARWDIAGQKRDARQDRDDGDEGDGIRRTDAVEETRPRARQRQGSQSTDGHADREKQHALADDQADHIAALRTQSDADAISWTRRTIEWTMTP
jgi:hypothetical protein